MNNKQQLRKEYKILRKSLSANEVQKRSGQIHDLLFSRIMMHRFSHIHLFLPITENKEVNTKLIVATLRQDFAPDIYIPKSYADGSLTHHLYHSTTVLKNNEWGVPEPANALDIIPETTFDLVLIPLLAFDKKGFRIGYGGGFYDRFLSNCSPHCLKIGLSFFEPVDEISDADKFDVKLNHCITPHKVWTF